MTRLRSRGLALLVPLLLTGAPAAGAELGAPAVTRLWWVTPEGREPVCTAAYIRDPYRLGPSPSTWVLTARHCAEGGVAWIGRDEPERRFGAAEPGRVDGDLPRGADVTFGRTDGTGPPSPLALAERMPRAGSVVIHGFPFGIEHRTSARILGDSAARPGSVELKVVTGPQTEAGPGFSGAPVLNPEGRVVGTLWGLRADDERTFRAFVTPVEVIRELLRTLPAGERPRTTPERRGARP